ncbi:kinase-like domain-containing protein [Lyophyllum atratum]|nr:kinase-like domain-containing protein [Lyophyllum atratum]
MFQQVLDMGDLDNLFRRRLIVATQRLSAKSGLYPLCYELKDVVPEGEDPVTSGGFADIYEAYFNGQKVCLKAVRMYQDTKDQDFFKRFSKEAILWGQLSHPNVLPIYGIHRFRRRFCLVSPWMEAGDMEKYLKSRPYGSRIQFAVDVAEGLLYLHNNDIIHGDLKSQNILIDDRGRARLADFGISSISDSKIPAWTTHSSAASKGGSVRWQAPELFDPDTDEQPKNTKASDIYAWSCVCYEIFTGDIPFPRLRDTAVMLHVTRGYRPLRPKNFSASWSEWGLTNDIWLLMQECWKENPVARPRMALVVAQFNRPDGGPRDPHNNQSSDSYSILSPSSFRQRMSQPINQTSLAAFRKSLANDARIKLMFEQKAIVPAISIPALKVRLEDSQDLELAEGKGGYVVDRYRLQTERLRRLEKPIMSLAERVLKGMSAPTASEAGLGSKLVPKTLGEWRRLNGGGPVIQVGFDAVARNSLDL